MALFKYTLLIAIRTILKKGSQCEIPSLRRKGKYYNKIFLQTTLQKLKKKLKLKYPLLNESETTSFDIYNWKCLISQYNQIHFE